MQATKSLRTLAIVGAFALTMGAAQAQTQTQTRPSDTIQNAVRQTGQAQGREIPVTSTYRTNSTAHSQNRAVDIRGTDVNTARSVSRSLGNGYTTIIEQPGGVSRANGRQTNTGSSPCAPGYQHNIGIRSGSIYKDKCEPYVNASANHTHIQKDSTPVRSSSAAGSGSTRSTSSGTTGSASAGSSRTSSAPAPRR